MSQRDWIHIYLNIIKIIQTRDVILPFFISHSRFSTIEKVCETMIKYETVDRSGICSFQDHIKSVDTL